MFTRLCLTLSFALITGAASAQATATASPPPASGPAPIADYWRPPAFSGPQMSPNGRYMAVGAAVAGRTNLMVIDLEKRTVTGLTKYNDFDVIDYEWVGNDYLIYSLGQRNAPTGQGKFEAGGLFSIKRDGREGRMISQTVKALRNSGQYVYRGLEFLDTVDGSDSEFIAAGRERTADGLDLYKYDLKTHRKLLLTPNRPERVQEYILDRQQIARIAVSNVKDTDIVVVYYRETEAAPWRELYRYASTAGPVNMPMYFDDDNETLIFASSEGRDTVAIYRYDPRTKTRGELLASHPRYDLGLNQNGEHVGGIRMDPKTRKVISYAVHGAKTEQVFTDESYAKLQRSFEATFPGLDVGFRRTPDGKRMIVRTSSDRHPARWYLFDEEKRSMEELFVSKPWMGPDKLVAQRPFFYKTRDGLEILGYYFLPRDYQPGQKLPTVVHIHGGPAARADFWGNGFGVIEGQLLASRGYAVVVPNFRITPGFGAKIYYSGKRQFGKAMQEDIEDATDWAVQQGFADAERICLSGASYGGYASLMGIAKTPDKYKCAIAGLAVTDLELIMTSNNGDIPYNEAAVQFWRDMVGDPAKDRDALRAVSPAYLASRMKAPVLMYSGIDDLRVPLEQPSKMRMALEAEGKKVVWIAKPEEGHGFGRLENNVDLYNQIFDFLGQHIGVGPTPAKASSAAAATTAPGAQR